MDPIERSVNLDGLTMSYYLYGVERAPTILFVHGAGLHARIWDAVIRRISVPCRVIAPDMRGHGKSSRLPIYGWETFGEDLLNFIDELGLKDLIAVGHSFGGHAIAQAAIAKLSAFKSLVLVEPALMSPKINSVKNFLAGYRDIGEHPMEKRKQTWCSLDEMVSYFQERFPHSTWKPEVLEDYCRYGVNQDSSGEVSLACPPILESMAYLAPVQHVPERDLQSLSIPVTVLRAGEPTGERGFLDFAHSFTRSDLAEHLPNVKDVFLADSTHFIPMQQPGLVAEAIEDQINP